MINEAINSAWNGFESVCLAWANSDVSATGTLATLAAVVIVVAFVRSFTHARVC